MKINICKHAGFCSGVKHAYNKAIEAASNGVPVYMLGLLVHNSQVIAKLEKAGIKSISSVDEIKDGNKAYVMISAHGIGPDTYKMVKDRGFEIIDTTCSWVKRAQQQAKELSDAGYTVVIVGDRNHTEVKGIMEWSGKDSIVIERPEDLERISVMGKVGVVAQTTQSKENLDLVVEKLKLSADEVKVFNTICNATSRMQSSAVEMAAASDVMIVVGDMKSANTKRLSQLCTETGTRTYHIQNASELDPSWFEGAEEVGVTAGASTPDWVVQEVVDKIPS